LYFKKVNRSGEEGTIDIVSQVSLKFEICSHLNIKTWFVVTSSHKIGIKKKLGRPSFSVLSFRCLNRGSLVVIDKL
jgi:hypothetical protein